MGSGALTSGRPGLFASRGHHSCSFLPEAPEGPLGSPGEGGGAERILTLSNDVFRNPPTTPEFNAPPHGSNLEEDVPP